MLTETVDVGGVPMTIVDTAGIRGEASNAVEAEGIARAVAARDAAAVTVLVLDRSAPLTAEDEGLLAATDGTPRVVVANKTDLPAAWEAASAGATLVRLSTRTGSGLPELRTALVEATLAGRPLRDTPPLTNIRHADLLRRALAATERARAAAAAGVPEEFVLSDIHETRSRLEEVTGARSTDDVLAAIFSKFCIGK
jgi:tRNA modification GTPase